MTDLTARAIIGIVARHYGTTAAKLIGRGRTGPLARIRFIAMWVLVTHTGMSLPAIGLRFGERDHTTILHGSRVVTALLAEDAEFAAEIDRLMARIHAAEAALAVQIEAEVADRIRVAVSSVVSSAGVVGAGIVEAHIVLDGVLGPAVKAYVEAADEFDQALYTRDEPRASRLVREALRDLRATWHASQPVPA